MTRQGGDLPTALLEDLEQVLRRRAVPPARRVDLEGALVADGRADDRGALFDACQKAARSGGGQILLPSGAIRLDGPPSGDPSGHGQPYLTLEHIANVWLVGRKGTRLVVSGGGIPYILLIQHALNVRFRNLEFAYVHQPTRRDDSGPKAVRLTESRDVTFDGVEVSGSPQYGLGVERSEYTIISGSYFHDTMADGVNANGCRRTVMLHNRTRRTGDDGLAVVSPEAAPAGMRGEGSIIGRNDVSSTDARGVFAMGTGVLVALNQVDLTSGAGIGIMRDLAARDPGRAAERVTILGNSVQRATTLHPDDDDGPNGGHRRTHGWSSGAAAIEVSEAARERHGLSAVPRMPHREITVAENTILAPGWGGIFLHDVDGGEVRANAISRPNAGGHWTNRTAIALYECESVVVRDNVVDDDANLEFSLYLYDSQRISEANNWSPRARIGSDRSSDLRHTVAAPSNAEQPRWVEDANWFRGAW